MRSARADLLDQLAVEREDHRHRIRLVGDIGAITDDLESVSALEHAVAPRAQEFAVAVEDQHGRILTLEHVDPVFRVARNPADQAEGLALGQLREIFDEFICVFTATDFHRTPPDYGCKMSMRQAARPEPTASAALTPTTPV